jgi:ubiquinone biosynthesis monooxygenase Coq7
MFFKHFTTISLLDKGIIAFDNFLKTMTHTHGGGGINISISDSNINKNDSPNNQQYDTKISIPLMKINHVGEVCAQALYQGQSFTTKVKYHPEMTAKLQHFLQKSSDEESHHLIWCKNRLEQLNGRISILTPFWYAGSFGLGMIAGLMKPSQGLGFILHTEEQVEKHLQEHQNSLQQQEPQDVLTINLLQKMQEQEKGHRLEAIALGAQKLPKMTQWQMSLMASGMKKIAFYI